MKILSIGAGAIGTYIGGSLALAGNQVVFLERQGFDPSSRPSITLRLDDQTHTIPNPVIKSNIEDILALASFDAGIFALKSFDTETALRQLAPYAEHLPPFLCLQNGVENEEKIGAALGGDKVISGTVTSAIGKPNPGEIVLERLRGVGIASRHPISQHLYNQFLTAGLNPSLIDDPQAMKWSKMFTNLVANASSAILGMPPIEIFSHPGLYRVEIMQLKETLAVMKKKNIQIINLPGTPVKALTGIINALPLAMSRPIVKKAVGGGRGDKMPSFYIDLHSGRPNSEVDYLNGAVVRAGLETNTPTPANQFLNSILLKLVSKEIPMDIYKGDPDKFLQDFSIFNS